MTYEDRLIKQIKNGNREFLDELIAIYYPAILRYCLWHMPDRESAQDATQETFLKLVRFIDRYEHRRQFRAFLYRIAANTCIDMIRNIPTAELSADMETENARAKRYWQTACYAEKGFAIAENRQQLATAFACLDASSRELVLLKYGQELTLREISKVTDLPLRTVQTKLRRALSKMKKTLDGESLAKLRK